MKNWKTVIILVLALLLFGSVYYHRGHPVTITERITDTLIVTHTIRDTVLKYVRETEMRTDTLTVYVTAPGDTITQTVYVPVPITQREYQTPEYRAIVEGYNPSLVLMETYQNTVYITNTDIQKVRSRWGLGVQVGYGYSFGTGKAYPYIGVGVSYNLLNF